MGHDLAKSSVQGFLAVTTRLGYRNLEGRLPLRRACIVSAQPRAHEHCVLAAVVDALLEQRRLRLDMGIGVVGCLQPLVGNLLHVTADDEERVENVLDFHAVALQQQHGTGILRIRVFPYEGERPRGPRVQPTPQQRTHTVARASSQAACSPVETR
jgi:hypothetical protein